MPIQRLLPAVHRDRESVEASFRRKLSACVNGLSPWPLFVFGGVGTGKTCAALALADYIPDAVYYNCRELVDEMADAKCDRLLDPAGWSISPRTIWEKIAKCKLAILDEIGGRNQASDHHYDTVLQFVDKRIGKPAIFLSNLDPSQLATIYDLRLSSRLAAGSVVHLKGQDRRVQRTAK